MKKALMNASVASMIYKFNMNNIKILESLGYQVDVACNFGEENPISKQEIQDFRNKLKEQEIPFFETSCPRSIFDIVKMIHTYKQLKKLADKEHYDLVHTQSPIGGVLCRLAFRKARKKGTKVIYQAHGFHFYKGAPLANWFIYYPIEKFCAKFTDVLITINQEDYELAKRKMKAKKIEYLPGVGIDLSKFKEHPIDTRMKREEVDIPQNAVWILAVGELIPRKNHENLIRAVARTEKIYLTIAGKGELQEYLSELISELKIIDRIKLIGFRTDISELCEACDIFAFPSFQEGLPVALMEAMASQKPVICSRVRGNTDLIDENQGGFFFEPNDVNDIYQSIKKIGISDLKEFGNYNYQKIKQFDLQMVLEQTKKIYRGGVTQLVSSTCIK